MPRSTALIVSTLEDVSFEVRIISAVCFTAYDAKHDCCYAGHASTIGTLSYAIRFWSKGTKRALFLRHEGFLSVLRDAMVSIDR